MRLAELLKEVKIDAESDLVGGGSLPVLDDNLDTVTSGRPSQDIASLKGIAQSSPGKLVGELGIGGVTSGQNRIETVYEIVQGMVTASSKDEEHILQQMKLIFSSPRMVATPSKTRVGVLIPLTGSGASFVGSMGGVKALRIFAFWFVSAVVAYNKVSGFLSEGRGKLHERDVRVKYSPGASGFVIYLGRGNWSSL